MKWDCVFIERPANTEILIGRQFLHYCLSVCLYDHPRHTGLIFVELMWLLGYLKEYFEPSSYTPYSDQVVAEI